MVTRIQAECRERLEEMKASMKKVREVIQKSGVVAEQQTRLRNGKEALLERGQWIDWERMLTIKAVVEKEGWARMTSLQERIKCVGLNSFVQVIFSVF